jgi:hypothetical protein
VTITLPTDGDLTAVELRAYIEATRIALAGPGPFRLASYRRFGRQQFALACQCADCARARTSIAEARQHLRRHHRRRTLTFDEILAASRASDPDCAACGKPRADHKRCGLSLVNGQPDRLAHARRVAAGKRLAQRRRSEIAGAAIVRQGAASNDSRGP